jgi:alpha-L-rhamnosidase
MKMKLPCCILLLLWVATSLRVNAQPLANLQAGFVQPPLEARPKALWCWVDGNFDLGEITRELEEAKAKGMGGLDIWDVRSVVDEQKTVPAGPPFMGPASVKAIGHAVREAGRLGLELGLIISSGWNSGGPWTRPEHTTMGLFRSSVTVSWASSPGAIKLAFPALPDLYTDQGLHSGKPWIERGPDGLPKFYQNLAVLAVPLRPDSTVAPASVLDLTSRLRPDGTLDWTPPTGTWRITRYVCAPTGQPLISHSPNAYGPMIDHFSAEATEAHLMHFINLLQPEIGDFRQSALKYLYTDSYEVRGEMWTPKLREEFKRRKGYDLLPYLPVLEGLTVGSREITERFQHDYRQVLSDLIIDNHYAKGREVCARFGLGFVAEAAGPGQPIHNCPFESLRSSGVLTYPRGEFWHKHSSKKNPDEQDLLHVIKGVASASHIYNQKYVEAEAFTSVWLWQESLAELKPTADRAFCEGLNRIVFHTFPHTPKAGGEPGWVYAFGTQISENQPWWPKAGPFMDYLARCSFMLQQGHFAADVLYYYGDEAPNFVPTKRLDTARQLAGYDYDVTNTDILLHRLEVQNGQLALPHGPRYAVLVLPDEVKMNLAVLQKIEQLVKAGATVIGPRPRRSYGLASYMADEQAMATLTARLWGRTDGRTLTENRYGKGRIIWGRPVVQVLQSLGLGPDFDVAGPLPLDSLDFIHRRTTEADIYMVVNKTGRPVAIDGKFRVGDRQPRLWDPVSGSITQTMHTLHDKQMQAFIPLPAYGSVFVVFADEEKGINSWTFSSANGQFFPYISPHDARQHAFTLNGNLCTSFEGELSAENSATGEQQKTSLLPLPSPIPLAQAWSLWFPMGTAGPQKLERLQYWSSLPGAAQYFSGIATYETELHLTEAQLRREIGKKPVAALLELDSVAIVAEVFVNGESAGTVWTPPYIVDMTQRLRPGPNQIRIEVANRWPNQLIGDAKLPVALRRTNSNVKRLPNGWMYPQAELPDQRYALPASGLAGKARIRFYYK